MCRHLAYVGEPVTLRSLIIDPPHGLQFQAWSPRLQRHGTVNVDGFGVGWYADGDPVPARYRRALAIWADQSFADLARVTRTRAMLAAVRSATPGTELSEAAAAPYTAGPWLFSHNGAVDGWPDALADLMAALPVTDLLRLEARCDSAVIWALVRRRLEAGSLLEDALAQTVTELTDAGVTGRFNLLLTDGEAIAATAAGDTLCYRACPGGVLVASEPADDEPGWIYVPAGSVLAARGGSVQVRPIAGGAAGAPGLPRGAALPAEAVLSQAGRSEAVPSEAVRSEAVLSEAVRSEAVRSDAVRSEAVPSEAVRSEAVPSEAVLSEAGLLLGHEGAGGLAGSGLVVRRCLPGDFMARSLREDVLAGLTATPKWLPPKWFYDDRGSELFEKITQLDEYYPTRAERAILTASAAEIAAVSEASTLVELGSGAADKTRLLLDALRAAGTLQTYVPVDVSEYALIAGARRVLAEYPGLQVSAVVSDFEEHLGLPSVEGRRLVAFLGSTIGNLVPNQRAAFLASLRARLRPGDALLLGTDLVKDPDVLIAAYDDSAGITAAFNKNILSVLNTELGADFDPDAFEHVAVWDPVAEWIEMRLRSTMFQQVMVANLDLKVTFEAGEDLRTEVSAKFRRDGISAELTAAGFTMRHWWTDQDGRFGLSLSAPD